MRNHPSGARFGLLLACLSGCVSLACQGAGSSEPAATPGASQPSDPERARLWSEAEAVWADYVERLAEKDGHAAADLASEPGLYPFARYRVAALALEQDQLLRMTPEDVLLVLELRALASAAELEEMTERDVFVTYANAGLLSAVVPKDVRIGKQEGDRLFLSARDKWLPTASLQVTPRGPRVLSANVQFGQRFVLRKRMGLSRGDVPKVPAERLLSEAARLLGRSADRAWWIPPRPVPEDLRRERLEKLNELAAGPPPSKSPSKPAPAPKDPPPKGKLGRLAPADIQREIRSHFDAFRVCYENGLDRDPNLEGGVTMRFVIERDGRVGVEQHSSDFPFEDVVDCIAVQFLTMQFPEPDGGIVTVTYPMKFSPG